MPHGADFVKLPPMPLIRSLLLIGLFLCTSVAQAQELPPPDFGSLPEASDPVTNDNSNDNSDSLEQMGLDEGAPPLEEPRATKSDADANDEETEKELFGEESADSNTPELEEGSHLLKFDFTGSAQFVQQTKNDRNEFISGEPYLEISYTLRFETPIDISPSRKTREIEVEMDISHWGTLAKNEFFECRLEIDMADIPLEITTRMQIERPDGDAKDVDPEDLKNSLALKLNFDKEIREDWFSLCTDLGGANLNTQGEAEEYYAELLKLVEPTLSAILVEEYEPSDTTVIELSAEPKIIDDRDIANDILLTGEGNITITPQ